MPPARSAWVATRNSFSLETLQSNDVQRNILQNHRNNKNRKIGVQTRLNHHPAALRPPDSVECQFEVPLISNSVLKKKIEGRNAATASNASGRMLSRHRTVLSSTASKDGSVFSSTSSDL